MKRWIGMVVLGGGLGLLPGLAGAGTLAGIVTNPLTVTGTIRVMLSRDGGFNPANLVQDVVADAGNGYAFANVIDGDYFIAAYLDRNSDGFRDRAEPLGVMPQRVSLVGGGVLNGLNLTLAPLLATAESSHTPTSYGVQLRLRDPLVQVAAVTVQGGMLAGALSLAFDPVLNTWTGSDSFGAVPPALPLNYTFSALMGDGSTLVLNDDVTAFMMQFVGGIGPSGAVYDWFDVTWSLMFDPTVWYDVSVNDLDHGGVSLWQQQGLSSSPAGFSAYPLPNAGTQLEAAIQASLFGKPFDANRSSTTSTFTYMGATDTGNMGGVVGCFISVVGW